MTNVVAQVEICGGRHIEATKSMRMKKLDNIYFRQNRLRCLLFQLFAVNERYNLLCLVYVN